MILGAGLSGVVTGCVLVGEALMAAATSCGVEARETTRYFPPGDYSVWLLMAMTSRSSIEGGTR